MKEGGDSPSLFPIFTGNMANFYSESEHLTLEEKIECLDSVISKLCDRFDKFEETLLEIKALLQEPKSNIPIKEEESPSPMIESNHIEGGGGTIGYCGQPDGNGFDNASITEEKGIRSLYEIRKTDDTHAVFLPLEDKLSRFRNNATSLLLPVCEIIGDISECPTFSIQSEDYGLLELEDMNYWKVIKKCIINCIITEQ